MLLIFSINASHTDRIGKHINDSPRKYANCILKGVDLLGKPRVLFFLHCVIPKVAHNYDMIIEDHCLGDR